MKIRPEIKSDINAIAALTYTAFENHPHHEVGAKPTEHLIVNNLRDSGALTLSLVAEDETGIIGHIAFSPVQIAGIDCAWFGLGPVSVIPWQQGKGIGGKLINAGLDILKVQYAEGIVLLGEPEYYGRFGFKAHPNLTLADVPAEYFLIKLLCENNADIPAGEVNYHPSFA
ncbi:GNAT family N-acetyltransferase [Moritella sp. Urea-trap-13]|uniref:GNAT family N-acetyltransferase n=1 Tax=Moritella sp. Urea-trap-13 TaxID=2058327 RepID=UPI000C3231A2|nr:N-acetyltransferase [Moritella sp. Urea-trap-13]PKH04908.1 GNAT family N-acetyltransferase [Moritella sp. Urea-trap-13]